MNCSLREFKAASRRAPRRARRFKLGLVLPLIFSAALAQDPFALIETLPKAIVAQPSEFTPIAVGPSHVVLVAANGDVVLYRKSSPGTPARLLSQVSVRIFFANPPGPIDRLTDPDVIFDPESQRFIMVMADTTLGRQQLLFAVSKSATPATLTAQDWFTYRIDRTGGEDIPYYVGDFDHLAVAGDKLLVGWQLTNHAPSGSLGAGAAIRVFDKRPLLEGRVPETAPVSFEIRNDLNLRPRPARGATPLDRTAERVFFDITSGYNTTADGRKVWLIGAVSGLSSQPTFVTREIASPFPSPYRPTEIPQKSAVPLTVRPHLAASPAYHDGSLWVFEWDGGVRDSEPSGIYWMELDVRTWPDNVRVVQSGIYREPGAWLFCPAGIVDAVGNLTLTFTRSNGNEFPSTRFTGRLATDPPGTLRPGATLNAGTRAWEFAGFILNSVAGAAIDASDGSVWIADCVPSPIKPPTNDGTEIAIGRLRPSDPLILSNAGRLANLSILTALGSGENFTVGAVLGGAGTSGPKPLLVRAAGPALRAAPFNVPDVLADPKIEIFSGPTSVATNDNWGGTAALVAAHAQVGAFPFADAASKDAAIVYTADAITPPATVTARISANTGPSGLVLAEIYDSTLPQAFTTTAPRLINVSVLKPLGTGLTAGFVVGGTTPVKVLVRAIGPSLGTLFSVSGAVADPKLELFDGASKSLATNDNWGGTAVVSSASTKVGAFNLDAASKDAALLAALPPGNYTVQVSPGTDGTGLVLVEIYEVP